MRNNVLIIPSLNPDTKFIEMLKIIVKSAEKEGLDIEIIVVNDGSSNKCDWIFEEIEKNNITVLKHAVNLGKGRALKTAFNYVLNNMKDFKSIVTADSDGQHSIDDIISCLKESNENPDTLVLGIRNFEENIQKIMGGGGYL